MTIDKLSSGSYRVRQMVDGKRYTIMFDHRPTKSEAEAAMREKIVTAGDRIHGAMTFKEAAIAYVGMKENVLSPNVVREYLLMPNRCSKWFTDMKIDDIDQIAINKQVNEWSARLSPKTVHNYHGFISAILGTFRPQLRIYTKLPQNRKSEPYIPSDEDVRRIIDNIGDQFKIPFMLSIFGLRNGEICALTVDDVVGNQVIINKAIALDKNRKYVLKTTKTTDSERVVTIPIGLADMIREQGFVYKGHPNSISKHLGRLEKKLDIEHFSVHKMRHYFASKMMTIADVKTILKMGGWKTDYVMKNVYAHSMKEEYDMASLEAVKEISKAVLTDVTVTNS